MLTNEKLNTIATKLSPERPIRSEQLLKGRERELVDIERELRHFHTIPFIYGDRGVGKTSLARTAAQIASNSDREHIYIPCAPGARMLHIFREIGEELLKQIFQDSAFQSICNKVEVELSLNPKIRSSFEKKAPKLDEFSDANAAVRTLKQLDNLLPLPDRTIIILDELEELNDSDRTHLAYFIKQIGDQEFSIKFILVGIAENVHELIGIHHSVPRYVKEISLLPLDAQYLIDIVENAATSIDVHVPRDTLFRIATVGNGFPHFAHLIGKAILIEAIDSDSSEITTSIYKAGVTRAVNDSTQELRISYEAATQRSADYFKHLVWALAHSDVVDIRIDEWLRLYSELAHTFHWHRAEEKKLRTAISNFSKESCGEIVTNTPSRYGSSEKRYRYKRYTNTLMRGHVRLQAENEGFTLGTQNFL
ncbi:MAG: ATP-binding protein [Candidatus Thiodiazotropha sp.]